VSRRPSDATAHQLYDRRFSPGEEKKIERFRLVTVNGKIWRRIRKRAALTDLCSNCKTKDKELPFLSRVKIINILLNISQLLRLK
jgi:hypothetical protein